MFKLLDFRPFTQAKPGYFPELANMSVIMEQSQLQLLYVNYTMNIIYEQETVSCLRTLVYLSNLKTLIIGAKFGRLNTLMTEARTACGL